MSDVDLKNGYTRIANDLLEAILESRFSRIEVHIILFVIRKTYGYQKKMDKISLRQMQKTMGNSLQRIMNSTNYLITKNVLFSNKIGMHRELGINKNFSSWMRSSVTETDTVSQKFDDISVTETDTPRIRNGYTSVTETDTQVLPKRIHTKERKKERNSTKEKTVKNPVLKSQKSLHTKKPKKIEIEYPDWLNVDLFQAYVENRIFMKSPMSANAQKLAIRKLGRLINDGDDQTELIELAIESNWKSFYPINKNLQRGKPNGKNGTGFKTVGERFQDELAEVAANLSGQSTKNHH